jgi:hypothetical protein
MNAAEKLKFFLESTDINPKLPISVEVLPESSYNVVVMVDDYKTCREYYINYLLVEKEAPVFSEEIALSSAVSVVRLRAQREVNGLELFPYVDVKNAGGMKESIQILLQGEESLETIDYKIMSNLSCSIWRKAGNQSLPLIRHLIPMHASDVISVASELSIKI